MAVGTQKSRITSQDGRTERKTVQLRAATYDDLVLLCQEDVRTAADQVEWLVREERNRRIARQDPPDYPEDPEELPM